MNFRRPSWSGFRPRPTKGYSYEDDAREASDDLDEEEPWPLPPKRLPKAPPKKAPPKGKGPKGPQGFKGPKAPEGPLAFWNERGDSRGRSEYGNRHPESEPSAMRHFGKSQTENKRSSDEPALAVINIYLPE